MGNTLWAFGCSQTAGEGLKDPSKEGYAGIIAKELGLELKNKGISGASNKHIFWTFQNNFRKITSSDSIILQWTHIERTTIILNTNEVYMIGPWRNSVKAKSFYTHLHNEVDALWNTVNYINLADFMCKKMSVNNVLHLKPPRINMKKLRSLIAQDVVMHENIGHYLIDRGLDNAHPGPTSHKQYAKNLLETHYGIN